MTLHDLSEALADSAELVDLAKRAGITVAQARFFAAALAELPIKQAIRLCTTARADRIRQINKTTRR